MNTRLIAALPVIAALLVYGFGAARLLLVLPLLVLVAVTIRREAPFWSMSDWKIRGTMVLGAVYGAMGELLVVAGAAFPPLLGPAETGPFPALGLAAVQGANVLGLALMLLTGERVLSWTLAFTLVVLAGHALDGRHANLLWVAAGLVVMVTAFLMSGFRGRKWLGFVGQALAALAVAGLIGALGIAGQGLVVSAMIAVLRGGFGAAGIGAAKLVGLNAASSVTANDRVVLEVEGQAPDRLRTSILTRFDGALWRGDEGLVAATFPVAPPDATMEIFFDQVFSEVFPGPVGTEALDTIPSSRTSGGLVLAPAGWGDRHQVDWRPTRATDAPGLNARRLPAELGVELLRHLPPGLPATFPERAEALEAWFQTEFRYSLTTDLVGDAHPLVILLQERRPAYCIYFASAFAAILRAEGHATRLIGGYVVEPANPLTGRRLVRERDAHAWVELWDPAAAEWVVFDPTPFREADDEGLFSALREALGRAVTRLALALATRPEEVLLAALRSPYSAGLAVIGLLILLYRWGSARRGGGADWRAAAALVGEPGALYRRYLELVRSLGVRPAPSASDDEILALLAEKGGVGIEEDARDFVERHRGGSFGGRPDELGAAAALDRLERGLKAKKG